MGDENALPHHYRNVPLEALRVSSRRRLSLYLNLERLPNESTGVVPDFNGLAECIGFTFLEMQNFARQNIKDPTSEVLNEWTSRPDMEPTVGKLFEYLQTMGREDVITDCKNNILIDIEHYLSRKERKQNEAVPLQDDTISQSSDRYDGTDHDVDEYQFMTITDVETGRETFYDAFVCYDPDGYDLQFVKRMLEELESPTYGLRLFVPWRDDLPGASAHTISARLIQYRCRRMVIIMSPRFLKSPSCDFQIKFAHSLSPGSRSKKLVPVLITPCHIPQILRHVTLCDFTKRDLMEWFWKRLARAIKAPLNFRELQVSKNISMDDITLDLQARTDQQASGSSHSSSAPLPIIHASTAAASNVGPRSPANLSQGSPANMSQGSPANMSQGSPANMSQGSQANLASFNDHFMDHDGPAEPPSLPVQGSPKPSAKPRKKHNIIPSMFKSSKC